MKVDYPGWLTVNQACRRLEVSRPALYRLIDEGRIPAYRIGRTVRLLIADVEAYRLRRLEDEQ